MSKINLINDNVIDYKYVKKLYDAAKKGINGEKKCIIKIKLKNNKINCKKSTHIINNKLIKKHYIQQSIN